MLEDVKGASNTAKRKRLLEQLKNTRCTISKKKKNSLDLAEILPRAAAAASTGWDEIAPYQLTLLGGVVGRNRSCAFESGVEYT